MPRDNTVIRCKECGQDTPERNAEDYDRCPVCGSDNTRALPRQ